MAINKRLNYFKGEFLHVKDFQEEQQYHIDNQCVHNKYLHTPGIAYGLTVRPTTDPRKLETEPGMAIDGAGRQIVLESPREIDLPADRHADQVLYLTIAYAEKTSDPINETGIAGDTRITGEPALEWSTILPGDDLKQLILAEVILKEDLTIQSVKESARKYAGVNAGELEVKRLTFPDLKTPVRIERSPANGALLVNASLTSFTAGKVGIGTGQPQAKLAVNGGLHVGGDEDPGDRNLLVEGSGVFGGGLEVKGNAGVNFTVDAKGNIILGSQAALNSTGINGKLVLTGLSGANANPLCFTGKYMRLSSDSPNMAVICNDVSSDNNALVIEGNKSKDQKTSRVLVKGELDVSDQFCVKGDKKFDLAEMTPVRSADRLEQGEVVVIDPENGLMVTRSTKARDTSVYGIVSSFRQAAIVIGRPNNPEPENEPTQLPIALIGRVKAKVSAEAGPVQPGDLLTTAATPGHLMRCNDRLGCVGAVAGKALEPLAKGTGLILVLVTLQ